MESDLHYRQNQKASNQQWHNNNPDYWKTYRQRNPDKAARNRQKQHDRNKKRRKVAAPVVKVELSERFVKMYLVNQTDVLPEREFRLNSNTRKTAPVKLEIYSEVDKERMNRS
jgi:hypothetical protein